MFLCAVDSDGMGVSLIQSNASGFGSLVFEPSTGIGLHNRGIGFSLVADHPAEYGPRRRPPHTLAPLIVTRPDGALRGVIGTMGGDAQPQILLQLLARWLHHGKTPGQVIQAGRFTLSGSARSGFDTWTDPDGVRVELEASGPPLWPEGLTERGHEVNRSRRRFGPCARWCLRSAHPRGFGGGILKGSNLSWIEEHFRSKIQRSGHRFPTSLCRRSETRRPGRARPIVRRSALTRMRDG
jgi:gamma-glutamyltranspeptidase